jgi:hypothetical protein
LQLRPAYVAQGHAGPDGQRVNAGGNAHQNQPADTQRGGGNGFIAYPFFEATSLSYHTAQNTNAFDSPKSLVRRLLSMNTLSSLTATLGCGIVVHVSNKA